MYQVDFLHSGCVPDEKCFESNVKSLSLVVYHISNVLCAGYVPIKKLFVLVMYQI